MDRYLELMYCWPRVASIRQMVQNGHAAACLLSLIPQLSLGLQERALMSILQVAEASDFNRHMLCLGGLVPGILSVIVQLSRNLWELLGRLLAATASYAMTRLPH